ncbi:MAG: adenylate/guanylate cyclase domain-containing protein [Spirochaetota bacterium]
MKLDEASVQNRLSLDDVYKHSIEIAEKYKRAPDYVALYIRELLRNNHYLESDDKKVAELQKIIEDNQQRAEQGEQSQELEQIRSFVEERDAALELQRASEEISFRKRIEEYYLPKQLVNAIIEKGEIPTATAEQFVGIGFIDIADYTFLSKFLSPNENQTVLNGLYAAFNFVLNRHGGYLNKIEGDSLMFHFGGSLDPNVRELDREQQERYIARELFYTCVEMQRVAFLFNQANDRFLYNEEGGARESITKAFEIIRTLRTSNELSPSINAFFQIRVRIGANIGEVTVGNFGPEGAKQWDIIGVPVIKAKRMESTAPVGGFRISEEFYNVLKNTGAVDEYYKRFKREAEALFGSFKHITMDELFKFGKVTLKDKHNAMFNTYSVQVNPGLPEAIMNQVDLLINKGEEGAQRILEMLKYYRGNRFVINGLESVFKRRGICIRKHELLQLILPSLYERILSEHNGDTESAHNSIENDYNLYNLFELLGKVQDTVKVDQLPERPDFDFNSYDQHMNSIREWMEYENTYREKRVYQRTYFYNYIFPMVFYSIRACIFEFQQQAAELTELSEADVS